MTVDAFPGFLFSLQIWGYSVHGHNEMAMMVEQRPDDQTFLANWWDRHAEDLKHELIDRGDGYQHPPLWWALRGCRHPHYFDGSQGGQDA